MKINLSDSFTYRKLLRFAFPSVLMMIFTSIYGVVDGYFISNYVGKTPFAAVNLIYPYLMVLGSAGFMFGTGGSALIGKTLGEGDNDKANRIFSMLVSVTAVTGVAVGIIGIVLIRPVSLLLGADEYMIDDCVLYGRILLCGLPALMLQYEFQSFFVTAEKPRTGFAVTVCAGCSNMVLDFVLVGLLKLGIPGAAAATVFSQVVGGVVPLFYFVFKKNNSLKFVRFSIDRKALLKTCTNGSSELVSNISSSFVSMLYNAVLMKYEGENGVAAYGALMFVCFIFYSMFVGFSVGTAPIISYHYGAQNTDELKNLRKKGFTVVIITAFAMLAVSELAAYPLAKIYVGYDEELMALTLKGFRYYSFCYLFACLPIFGSSFFTALNDGLTSALISFLRTVVFQVAAVLVLPLIFGSDGIWLSLVFAEFAAAAVTVICLAARKKKYNY